MIANDAIISDILATLDDAERYLRGVFGNMVEYRKHHETAVVRIGTTGQGIAPHYRVQKEHSREGEDLGYFADVFNTGPIESSEHFMAFHGRSHKKLEWGAEELQRHSWSIRAMSYDEVQALLGHLRGFKGLRK
jgi:hypothetical protein